VVVLLRVDTLRRGSVMTLRRLGILLLGVVVVEVGARRLEVGTRRVLLLDGEGQRGGLG